MSERLTDERVRGPRFASIEEAQAAIARAREHIHWMCQEKWAGRSGWRWQIPVNEKEDSDCILHDGLSAAEFVLAARAGEREALAAAVGRASMQPGIGHYCADGFEGALKRYREAVLAYRAAPGGETRKEANDG